MRVLLTFVVLSLLSSQAFSQVPQQNGLVGVIFKSDNHKAGEKIVFANLEGSHPFVTYPSGGSSETVKVFENEDLIVLFFVANVTGSTETYYINKNTGEFTFVEVGTLEAIVRGTEFQPKTTHGKFE